MPEFRRSKKQIPGYMENIIWSSGHKLQLNNIIDSENCYVYDAQGKKYIDLESGVWCTCLGHNNKRINDVIISQINKITHTGFCYCNPVIEQTAKSILEITGMGEGKCEFLCSGSEAVEYGIRIARTVSDKPLALCFSDSYFGAYGDAAQKSGNSWFSYNWIECSCTTDRGCVGECVEFDKIPFDKIGIFLFEPGSSSGLVRFPSLELITKINFKMKDSNGIVMANEITTGIGRTGKWFGYQHYDILPDIVAIGKGIGNGYPVSVTAVSDRILQKLKGKNFLYAQSHQNDPLGAAVAAEVIKVIREDNLLNQCVEKGQYLFGKLNQLKNVALQIKQVRGRGLMLAIEFNKDSQYFYEELLRRGFIVAKRNNAEVLRIDPALTVEKTTLDEFLQAMADIARQR